MRATVRAARPAPPGCVLTGQYQRDEHVLQRRRDRRDRLDADAKPVQQRLARAGSPRLHRARRHGCRSPYGAASSTPSSASSASSAAISALPRFSKAQADLQQLALHCIALQRRRGAQRDQLAAIHEPDPLAALGLVHVVRRDEQRHALLRPARRAGPRGRGAPPGRRRRSARRGTPCAAGG